MNLRIQAELAALRAEVEALKARVEKLEAQKKGPGRPSKNAVESQ